VVIPVLYYLFDYKKFDSTEFTDNTESITASQTPKDDKLLEAPSV